MAGSLSGVGSGQVQSPISQTFKPGGTAEARQQDEQRKQSHDVTTGQGTNGVQDVKATQSHEKVEKTSSSHESGGADVASAGDSRRGSLVNITV